MIPTEIKATPIFIPLKLCRQLLALCTPQSFDARVTVQKHLLLYNVVVQV